MRRKHAVAATATATSCRLLAVFVVKSAFVFGLCAMFSSTTSASISPSTIPSAVYNRDYNRDRSDEGRGITVDGSEDENNNHDYDYDYDYDYIPWQPSPTNLQNIDEAARYEDMPPIVFSPTGRLHPVEAAVRASKTVTPLSNLLVAMRCRDGLVVISTLPISPHLDARIATTSIRTAVDVDGDVDANTTRTNTSSSDSSNDTDNDNDNGTSDICSDGVGNATSASTTDNETTNDDDNDNDDDNSLYPSLFLFDETCSSTVTGPIFDIHPCIVGATAGNAVDNRIMRTKLLALGLNALENQGAFEEDVTTGRVAKDLANQLQVVTQDIGAAQKQKLGRMLAVSSEHCALLCCVVLCFVVLCCAVLCCAVLRVVLCCGRKYSILGCRTCRHYSLYRKTQNERTNVCTYLLTHVLESILCLP
jgi:hypothetical protein